MTTEMFISRMAFADAPTNVAAQLEVARIRQQLQTTAIAAKEAAGATGSGTLSIMATLDTALENLEDTPAASSATPGVRLDKRA